MCSVWLEEGSKRLQQQAASETGVFLARIPADRPGWPRFVASRRGASPSLHQDTQVCPPARPLLWALPLTHPGAAFPVKGMIPPGGGGSPRSDTLEMSLALGRLSAGEGDPATEPSAAQVLGLGLGLPLLTLLRVGFLGGSVSAGSRLQGLSEGPLAAASLPRCRPLPERLVSRVARAISPRPGSSPPDTPA